MLNFIFDFFLRNIVKHQTAEQGTSRWALQVFRSIGIFLIVSAIIHGSLVFFGKIDRVPLESTGDSASAWFITVILSISGIVLFAMSFAAWIKNKSPKKSPTIQRSYRATLARTILFAIGITIVLFILLSVLIWFLVE
ncbi:MAG TPA: hypothetical protein VJA22_02505 [Patescibacteria group bacterium]|nr:hypothetical protein [Patescibacteria group bacterium]